MIIYIALLVLIVAEAISWFFIKPNKIVKIIYSLLPALFLYIIFSFRSVDVGRDTIIYYEKFNNLTSLEGISLLSDPGYYLSAFIVHKVFNNFNVFLAIMGLIVFVPLFFLIFLKSKNPGMAYLIYVFTCLSMTLSALRQTIAMGFCIIAVLLYLKPKLHKLFCLIPIAVAITFHSSAAIFLLCIPFVFIKPSSRMLIFMTFLGLVFVFMGNSFGSLLAQLNITFYGVNSNLSNIPELGIFCFISSVAFVLLWEKGKVYSLFEKLFPKKEYKFIKNTNDVSENEIKDLSASLSAGFLLSFFMLLSSSNNVFPRMSIFFVPFFILSSNALIAKNSKILSFIVSILFTIASVAIFAFLFLYSDRLDCVPFSFL